MVRYQVVTWVTGEGVAVQSDWRAYPQPFWTTKTIITDG